MIWDPLRGSVGRRWIADLGRPGRVLRPSGALTLGVLGRFDPERGGVEGWAPLLAQLAGKVE